MRLTLLILALAAATGCATPGQTPAPAVPERAAPLTVFLVRHAEKVDSSRDPALSPDGHLRAEVLAQTLRDAGITRIHSTDFIRTRDTAAPLAQVLGIAVESYDPRSLPAFAEGLRASGGRHLVVGHSNTTPGLVAALGGEAGAEIDEASEYDRLYVVTRAPDGSITTTLLRFGDPYVPAS